MRDKLNEILPKVPLALGLCVLSQLLSTVNEIFMLSPIDKSVIIVLSTVWLCTVTVLVESVSMKWAKLSVTGGGGGLPLLTGLSLPQATINSNPNIFKCSMAFLTEFKTFFILYVISGLRFIVSFASGVNSFNLPFTFLIPHNLSNFSLCHLIVSLYSFLLSGFNFFTHKYNEISSHFQMNKLRDYFIITKPFYYKGVVCQ